jgi:hypothetical protein
MNSESDDRLRKRREHDFRARVLAALERPKQSSIGRIINTPLFIWLLSAAFLTVGGGYFTHYQQCSRDVAELRDRFYRLSYEVYRRSDHIAFSVKQANSVHDIRSALNALPTFYSDYRQRTLRELQRELRQIQARIEPTDAMKALSKKGYDSQIPVAARDLVRFGSISLGELARDIKDSDLEALKDFMLARESLFKTDYVLHEITVLTPRCSATSVLVDYVFARTPKILVAHPQFEQADWTWDRYMSRFFYDVR